MDFSELEGEIVNDKEKVVKYLDKDIERHYYFDKQNELKVTDFNYSTGKKLKHVVVNNFGKLIIEYQPELNEPSKTFRYNTDGELRSMSEYNSDGIKVKSTVFGYSGKSISKFDPETGNEIFRELYKDCGRANDQITSSIEFDRNTGLPTKTTEYSYSLYNPPGKRIVLWKPLLMPIKSTSENSWLPVGYTPTEDDFFTVDASRHAWTDIKINVVKTK